MKNKFKHPLAIFICALLIRIIAAIGTTLTSANPSSQADAIKFGQTAAYIAHQLPEALPPIFHAGPIGTYPLWGSFLAPFWLIPGPSGLYARLANGLLGAIAIYNVYRIARYHHSHQAGVLAALPMMIYPSFVAVHSTLLREAFVLFGMTTAARIWLTPGATKWRSHAIAGLVLYLAYIQRPENGIIFAVAIASTLFLYAIERGYVSTRTISALAAISPAVIIFSLPFLRKGVTFLAMTRENRTLGRAEYLANVIPQTVPEFITFSWIAATYFLFTPFPWMIRTVPDFIAGIEGIVSIGYTISAIWGIRVVGQKRVSFAGGLLIGLIIGVVLYGVGTGNYGAATRHRQMFLWVIFIFGGIGVSEYIRIRWPLSGGRRFFKSSRNSDD